MAKQISAKRQAEDLDSQYVKDVYSRLSFFYDMTFGILLQGRKNVVRYLNGREGRLLDVGVGTGLHLGDYARSLEVVGVDLSPDMLKKAQHRVAKYGYDHVKGLHEMDASRLEFPDESFDTVVGMYLLPVVEVPDAVMAELARVCRIGGEVVIVNHFSREGGGVIAFLEKLFIPIARRLGWRSQFPLESVLSCDKLRLVGMRDLGIFRLFKMLRFVRRV